MSQSVQRAIELIRLSAEHPISLTDAARILDVHKSTALRILQTLEAERFVRKTGAGTYVFGSGLIELSELTLGSMDLRQHAGNILRTLQHRVGHTVHLAQLTGDEINSMMKRRDRIVQRFDELVATRGEAMVLV